MRIETSVLQQCWFLAGPTACGKTPVGLALADRLQAEIVALDSMSLYRGMDIGTAKPTRDDMKRVRHHLVDILDPWEEFSVAQFVQSAGHGCDDILQRGRIPLFVGGTGLYLRAVLRGVFEGPEADWTFRRLLEEEAAENPPGTLHRRLQDVDALTAARLHPHDQRRIIRALEVHHLTGQPASAVQSEQPLPESDRPEHVFWLSPPRDWLHNRIDRRVSKMLATGWVDEARALTQLPQPLSRTARRALGYDVLFEHLDGQYTLAQAEELIQTRTRQFAKRQHTWFRNLIECRACEISGDETPEEIADRLVASNFAQ